MNRPMAWFSVPLALWSLAAPQELAAADYTLEALKESAPKEVAGDLQKVLAGEGFRLLDKKGQPFVDFWLRKEIPLFKPAGDKPQNVKFTDIAEGSFLGVIRYHKKHYDFKDKAIPPGLYTLRNGIQPMDGDHLGVAPSRDFALLSPVSADTQLDPLPTKKLVELSIKVSGTKHPSIVFLTPMDEERASFPALTANEEKGWLICDVRLPFAGEKDKYFRFGLVVVGVSSET